MARPSPIIAPTLPALLVDGLTHFVAHTPSLRTSDGRAIVDRMVHLGIATTESGDPIHGTLAGLSVHIGDGVYTRAFLARDLERHLTVHAGRKVWLVPKCPGVALVSIPYRVVLARDVSFPVRQ